MDSKTMLLLTLAATSVTCWTITKPMPPRLTFTIRDTITMVMHSNVALDRCQCRLYWTKAEKEPQIDLSLGNKSVVKHQAKYNAQYSGTGLENGQCGLTLGNVLFPYRLLVCRARPAVGSWQYQQVELVDADQSRFSISVQPRHVVQPSTTAALQVCKAERPLVSCSIRLPRETEWITFSRNSINVRRYRYSGSGFNRGECGVRFSAAAVDSGLVWCWVTSTDGLNAISPSLLLVSAPPTFPVHLSFPSGSSFPAGSHLTATCSASASRPVANITWLLGDQVIRQDEENDYQDVPDDSWYWPWDKQELNQTLVHVVRREDDGKVLICRVDHLGTIRQDSKKITVTASIVGPTTTSAIVSRFMGGSLTNTSSTNATSTDGDSGCGIKGPSNAGLIASGKPVSPGEYPWHVGIYERYGDSFNHQCGGTLITPRVVISAAHCFWRGSLNHTLFKVSAGRTTRRWDTKETGEQSLDLEAIHIKDRFPHNVLTLNYDIAVVILTSPFTLSPTINVACFDFDNSWKGEQLQDDESDIVAGWGMTGKRGIFSESLQSVHLPWVSYTTCWNSLPKDVKQLYTDDKFCAGHVDKNTSVCPGDSGGGLLFRNDVTKRYYLRGIVSATFAPKHHVSSNDGCYSDHYTAFTNVSYYRDWVKGYLDEE